MTSSQIRLGFDSYSLRGFKWKAARLLEFAIGQKLDSIQFSSLDDFDTLETAYLTNIKDQASKARMTIDGGIGCICPASKSWSTKNGTPEEYLARGIRAAHALGATSMRCYMGASADRLGAPGIEACIEATIKPLRAVKSLADDLNVKVAVENHSGDMQAWELRELIEAAGKGHVAANLDTGNPMWVVEDPMTTLEVLGPYTVTTHIRDSVVFEHPRGAAAQWVALGDGVIDFKKFVARFIELCPHSTMQLENITGRPPTVLAYLEPGFWKAFPKARAHEFARFVELARTGHPYMGFMVVEDGANKSSENDAALRDQQRRDLERGFEFARKTLDVGINWR